MKKNQQQDIDELNNLSIVSYLKLLGFKPETETEIYATFRLGLGKPTLTTVIVDHDTNVFIDKENSRKGTLVDLIYLLFSITREDLLEDIVPYRIDLLIAESQCMTPNRA